MHGQVTDPVEAAERGKPVAQNGKKNVDDALVLALATGLSVPTAARRAGASERTAYRRLKDPAFRRRVAETRSALLSEAVGKLIALAGRAADALGELLSSERDLVKLQAAKSILELGPRLREAGELAERLEALERRVAGGPAAAEQEQAQDADAEECEGDDETAEGEGTLSQEEAASGHLIAG